MARGRAVTLPLAILEFCNRARRPHYSPDRTIKPLSSCAVHMVHHLLLPIWRGRLGRSLDKVASTASQVLHNPLLTIIHFCHRLVPPLRDNGLLHYQILWQAIAFRRRTTTQPSQPELGINFWY